MRLPSQWSFTGTHWPQPFKSACLKPKIKRNCPGVSLGVESSNFKVYFHFMGIKKRNTAATGTTSPCANLRASYHECFNKCVFSLSLWPVWFKNCMNSWYGVVLCSEKLRPFAGVKFSVSWFRVCLIKCASQNFFDSIEMPSYLSFIPFPESIW